MVAVRPRVEDAYSFLERLSAPPRLIHHAQVVEAVARDLVQAVQSLGLQLDDDFVRVGAIVHDVGKIVHLEELENPGHLHESAGKRLPIDAGFPENIASACVWHANWRDPDLPIEYVVIALADKLWKGKREDELEALLISRVSEWMTLPQWEVFNCFDTAFEG